MIRSPIAGRVTDLSVGVGQFYNDPTVPVLTVADLATVWLSAGFTWATSCFIRIRNRLWRSMTAG